MTGVAPDGSACGSRRRGTLESVASGRALERDAAAFGRPLDARELSALSGRDPRAGALVDRAAAAVTRALADLAAVLDPDLVGGGRVGLAPGFLELLAGASSGSPSPSAHRWRRPRSGPTPA